MKSVNVCVNLYVLHVYLPCLVFDIKRNGCVEITKQHSKNLRVDVSNQNFAILVHRTETIITYECFWPIKRVYFLLFRACIYWKSTWLSIPKNSASKTGLKRVRMSLCALILSPLLNWNIIVMKDGKCLEEEEE